MLNSTFNKNISGNDIKMDGSPEFDDRASQIQGLKFVKDQCCESCTCKSEKDHNSST